MKNYIALFFITFLTAFLGYSQDVSIAKTKPSILSYQTNNTFSLELIVGGVKVQDQLILTLPEMFIDKAALSQNTNSNTNNPTLIVNNSTKEIIITFNEDVLGKETNLIISNLKFSENTCYNQTYNFQANIAGVQKSLSLNVDLLPFETYFDFSNISLDLADFQQNKKPLQYVFKMDDAAYYAFNNIKDGKVTLNFDLNSSSFNILSIAQSSNSYIYVDDVNLVTTIGNTINNNSNSTFTIEIDKYYNQSFIVYLEPIGSNGTFSFAPSLTYSFTACENNTEKFFEKEIDFPIQNITIDDDTKLLSYSSVVDFQPTTYYLSACEGSYSTAFEIDNSFKATSLQEEFNLGDNDQLYIRFSNLPKDIFLQKISSTSPQLSTLSIIDQNNEFKTINNAQLFTDKTTSPQGFILPLTNGYSYHYLDLNFYYPSAFAIQGENLSYEVFAVDENNNLKDNQPLYIGSITVSESTNSPFLRLASAVSIDQGNTWNNNSIQMNKNPKTEEIEEFTYINNRVHIHDSRQVGIDGDFRLEFPSYTFIDGDDDDLRYGLQGDTPMSLSDFIDKYPEQKDMKVNVDNGKGIITIENHTFLGCQSYYLYIYSPLKISSSISSGEHNVYIYYGDNRKNNISAFKIDPSRGAKFNTSYDCLEGELTDTYTGIRGEDISFSFDLKNTGTETFEQVSMLTSFPFQGDRSLQDRTKYINSNYEFESLIYKGIYYNNQEISDQFNVFYTKEKNPCLSGNKGIGLTINDQTGCKDITWLPISSGTDLTNATYFKIGNKTNSILNISPAQKLSIEFQGNIPSSVSINAEGHFEIIGIITDQDNIELTPNKGSMQITIGESSSCETADVATLFTYVTDCSKGNEVFFEPTISKPTITKYTWDFGNGVSKEVNIDVNDPEYDLKKKIAYTYPKAGVYQVRLSTVNDKGELLPSTTREVKVGAPIANFTVEDICLGGSVPLSNVPENADKYEWNFHVGSTDNNNYISEQKDPLFYYPTTGDYIIELKVSREDGKCENSIQQTVTVSEGVNLSHELPVTACVGAVLDFEAIASSPSGKRVNVKWDFGDGNESSLAPLAHNTYESAGEYKVTLTASSEGCQRVVTNYIYITHPPQITIHHAQEKDSPIARYCPNGVGLLTTSLKNKQVGIAHTYAWKMIQDEQGDEVSIALGEGSSLQVNQEGIYEVTVGGSCQGSSQTIQVLPHPDIIAEIDDIVGVSCQGLQDGEATVKVTRTSETATVEYETSWGKDITVGNDNLLNTSLFQGYGNVQVTDKSTGCIKTVPFNIPYAGPTVSATQTKIATCSADPQTGEVEVETTSGRYISQSISSVFSQLSSTEKTTYTGNEFTASSLKKGLYIVESTFKKNENESCIVKEEVLVNHQTMVLTAADQYKGCKDAFVQVSASATLYNPLDNSSSSDHITYSWESTSSSTILTGNPIQLAAGTYTLTASNTEGCSQSKKVNITAAPQLAVSLIKKDPTCSGVNNGRLKALVKHGSGDYTYTWTTEGVELPFLYEKIEKLSAGSYQVEIKEDRVCLDATQNPIQYTASIDLIPAYILPTIRFAEASTRACDISITIDGNQGFPANGTVTWYRLITQDENGDDLTGTALDPTHEDATFNTAGSGIILSDVPVGTYKASLSLTGSECSISTLESPTDYQVITKEKTTNPNPFKGSFVYKKPEAPQDPVFEKDEQKTLVDNTVLIQDLYNELLTCKAIETAEGITADELCYNEDNYTDEVTLSYDAYYTHHTLYYYDRKGQLVKTVPPEGVDYLSNGDVDKIIAARRGETVSLSTLDLLNEELTELKVELAKLQKGTSSDNQSGGGVGAGISATQAAIEAKEAEIVTATKELEDSKENGLILPSHHLVTQYEYNGFGQPSKQTTPDGGSSTLIYDGLQQIRFSQTDEQATRGAYSYTKYDHLARPIEVGEATLNTNQEFSSLKTQAKDNTYLQDDPFSAYPTENRSEVVYTYYNTPHPSLSYQGEKQTYLLNNVSYVIRDEDGDLNTTIDQVTSVYSYDPHGNIKWLIQNIPGLGPNYVEYEYDLISGKVLEVAYNKYRKDRFFHRYEYDVSERVIGVYTSLDGEVWDQDESQSYRTDGVLLNNNLGEDNLQQLDYTYTAQGWLKGVNVNQFITSNTSGNTNTSSGNLLEPLGDVYSMVLNYYQGDYTNSSFDNNQELNDVELSDDITPHYNGNIASWHQVTQGFGDANIYEDAGKIVKKAYEYDVLNRIKSSHVTTDQTSYLSSHQDQTVYVYDRNGNLTQLARNDHSDQNTNIDLMSVNHSTGHLDHLVYIYPTNTQGEITSNQLLAVMDKEEITQETGEDLGGVHFYTYDEEGNLEWEIFQKEQKVNNIDITTTHLQYITWTVDGKVKEIEQRVYPTTDLEDDYITPFINPSEDGLISKQEDIETLLTSDGFPTNETNLVFAQKIAFLYNSFGNRISKRVFKENEKSSTPTASFTGFNPHQYTEDLYVTDASGNVMSIYTKEVNQSSSNELVLSQKEVPIYGGQRIGMYTPQNTELLKTTLSANFNPYTTSFDKALSNPVQAGTFSNWLNPHNSTRLDNGCNCEVNQTTFTNGYEHTSVNEYSGRGGNDIALAEDQNGNLLFYTQTPESYLGQENQLLVYTNKHHLMKGGTGLVGNADSKTAIMQQPQDADKYYIFSNDVNQNLYWYEVDMGKDENEQEQGYNGEQGIVLSIEVNDNHQLQGSNYGQHKVVIEDPEQGYQLITTRYVEDPVQGYTEIVYFLVDENGINSPQVLDTIRGFDQKGQGELQLNEYATQLAYYNRKQYLTGFDYQAVEINLLGLNENRTATTSHVKIKGNPSGTTGKNTIEYYTLGEEQYVFFNQDGVFKENSDPVYTQVLKVSENGVLDKINTTHFGDLRRGKDGELYMASVSNEGGENQLQLYNKNGDNNFLAGTALQATTNGSVSYLPTQVFRQPIIKDFTYHRIVGQKRYECKDHLGNIHAVITDKKAWYDEKDDQGNIIAEYCIPDIVSLTDYYPFGMQRNNYVDADNKYRFAFNGMKKDDEIKGEGNSYHFGARMYDPRLGRWLSRDPLEAKYPMLSGYNFVANSPITFVDYDGKDFGVRIEQVGDRTVVTVVANIYPATDMAYEDAKRAADFYNGEKMLVQDENGDFTREVMLNDGKPITYVQDGQTYELKFDINVIERGKDQYGDPTNDSYLTLAENDPIGNSITNLASASLSKNDEVAGVTAKSKYMELDAGGLSSNDILLDNIHEISHVLSSGVVGDSETEQGHTKKGTFTYGYAYKDVVVKGKNEGHMWEFNLSPDFVKNVLQTGGVVDTGMEFTDKKRPPNVENLNETD